MHNTWDSIFFTSSNANTVCNILNTTMHTRLCQYVSIYTAYTHLKQSKVTGYYRKLYNRKQYYSEIPMFSDAFLPPLHVQILASDFPISCSSSGVSLPISSSLTSSPLWNFHFFRYLGHKIRLRVYVTTIMVFSGLINHSLKNQKLSKIDFNFDKSQDLWLDNFYFLDSNERADIWGSIKTKCSSTAWSKLRLQTLTDYIGISINKNHRQNHTQYISFKSTLQWRLNFLVFSWSTIYWYKYGGFDY